MSTENPLGKSYAVALYKDMKYGSVCVFTYYGERDADYHGGTDVRISEPVEINFQALQNDEVIRNAVAACDAAAREARLELERKLAQIREQRSQFLALTHAPEGA